jgi:hypothetical protein
MLGNGDYESASVWSRQFQFTSGSAYIAINAITMGFACDWPQESVLRNVIMTVAPEELSSLVVEGGVGGSAYLRSFNVEDLTAPVPAKAYFGSQFAYGWRLDGPTVWPLPTYIVEGQYQPKLLVPRKITDYNPTYSRCLPFLSEPDDTAHWGRKFDNMVVWDPPIILTGEPVTSLPTATATQGNTITGPTAPNTGSRPLATPQSQISRDQSATINNPPSNTYPTIISENKPSLVFDSQIMSQPPGLQAITTDGLTILQGSGSGVTGGRLVVSGTQTQTLVPAGPAITMEGRTLSMNAQGLIDEKSRPVASSTIKTSSLGTFIASGSTKSLLGTLIASGSKTARAPGTTEVTYAVDGNPGLSMHTAGSAETTTSGGIRSYGLFSSTILPSVFSVYFGGLILAHFLLHSS